MTLLGPNVAFCFNGLSMYGSIVTAMKFSDLLVNPLFSVCADWQSTIWSRSRLFNDVLIIAGRSMTCEEHKVVYCFSGLLLHDI